MSEDTDYPTPNKAAYHARLEAMNKEVKHTDLTALEIGDYLKTFQSRDRSSVTGFVTKIGRVNVTIESTYGGMGGNDIHILELKVRKDNIEVFVKPLTPDLLPK